MHYSEWLGKIYVLEQYLQECIAPVCKEYHLNGTEMTVLLFLYNNPTYDRAVDIVNLRGITKSHVSMSVRSLEEKAFLLCSVHPKDRRTVLLELTDAGRHVAAQARQVQESFFQSLYEGIDPKDLAIWNRVRNQISDNIQKL